MRKDLSLHIGLNELNWEHYLAGIHPNNIESQQEFLRLFGCENDATFMRDIAAQSKFETHMLLGEMATRNNFLEKLNDAAARLNSYDTFLVTYAGHGTQVRDLDGDEEDDRADEVLCLYDGLLFDDEIKAAWAKFKPNVQIVFLVDACHSGSMSFSDGSVPPPVEFVRSRNFDGAGMDNNIVDNQMEFYEPILNTISTTSLKDISASILQIAACQDYETSQESDEHGILTHAIKTIKQWNAIFTNHEPFFDAIASIVVDKSNGTQNPMMIEYGTPQPHYIMRSVFS